MNRCKSLSRGKYTIFQYFAAFADSNLLAFWKSSFEIVSDQTCRDRNYGLMIADHQTFEARPDDSPWALSGKKILTERINEAYPTDTERFVQHMALLTDWPV
jgi:hypothetical protein